MSGAADAIGSVAGNLIGGVTGAFQPLITPLVEGLFGVPKMQQQAAGQQAPELKKPGTKDAAGMARALMKRRARKGLAGRTSTLLTEGVGKLG